MTFLVPIMLFGWVPLTILLFMSLPAHRAVLVSVIGGWLLLPTAGYILPGFPDYGKGTAIALGLILGGWLSGKRQAASFEWRIYDLPMIIWCLCPMLTSLTNDLGWYDGLSATFDNMIAWAVPYLAGRIYFNSYEKLKDLCLGIVIGGMVYVPLCLYEIRMSPRLNINLYGFFAHEWRQHSRYSGWRPIVFMQHGLMVAVWMALSATMSFWLWRSRIVDHLKGIPMAYIFIVLAITAVLCKAASGWFALAMGCGAYFFHRRFNIRSFTILLILVVPLYMSFRISGVIEGQDIGRVAVKVFDAERAGSLGMRLFQEDLFIEHAMESPVFGWGAHSRNWPVDPYTGAKLVRMVDALWIILFSKNGFLGILSWSAAMLVGPWLVFRSTKLQNNENQTSFILPVTLSLIVVLFMIDSMVNAMIGPIYITITGALTSWHLEHQLNVVGFSNSCSGVNIINS